MSDVAFVVATFLDYKSDSLHDGGRPRIVRDLARYFSALNNRVVILQKGLRDETIEFEPKIRVQKVGVPIRAWADIVFALRTRSTVERATLCCYASPEDGFPFFSQRAFAIQHGVWWDGPFRSRWKAAVTNQICAMRALRMCSRVKAVICVDTNFINWLRLFGSRGHIAASKCIYIPNYVDLAAFPPPSVARLRQRFERRHLLFLRRFEAPRGPLLFLETCAALRNAGVRFTAEMVGWGAEADRAQAAIRDHGLEGIVTMGRATLDEVPSVLDRATALLTPTLYSEGTSMSCLEAMAMGVPVISTDVGGLGNITIPGFNGFICQPTPQSFSSAVCELLSSFERYCELAGGGLGLRPAISRDAWYARVAAGLGQAGLNVPMVPSGPPRPTSDESRATALSAARPSNIDVEGAWIGDARANTRGA